MSEVVRKNLGSVTAYKYAVSKGYTGTEEEFAELMASYATVAEEAAQSASEAAQSASDAETSSETSEAYAKGTRNGSDVSSSDPAYHNNSKYYAEQADGYADSAGTSASTATDKAGEASASAASASASATTATAKAGEAASSAASAASSASAAGTSETNAAASAGTASNAASNAASSASAAQAAQAAAETAQGKAEDAQEAAEAVEGRILSDYAALDAEVDAIADTLRVISPSEPFAITTWNQGTINTSGANSNSDTRCRTNTYYQLDGLSLVASVKSGYQMSIVEYSGSTASTYIGRLRQFSGDDGVYTIKSDHYYRFIVKKADDSDLAYSDVPSDVMSITLLKSIPEAIDTKAPVISTSLSGSIVTFADGADMPLKALTVGIDYVQSGTGDPSPTNVRPITGWAGANIYTSGADTSNPTTYSITFPSSAGTVYGGTLDVKSGVLKVDRAVIQSEDIVNLGILSSDATATVISVLFSQNDFPTAPSNAKAVSNRFSTAIASGIPGRMVVGTNTLYLVLPTAELSEVTADGVKQWLAANPTIITYVMASAVTYNLTPTDIHTLLGDNSIWADTGDVNVEYCADTKIYIADAVAPKVVTVSGTALTITAEAETRYVCGTVESLSFTPCASGICDIVFTSGSTPAVLTLPNTVKLPEWFTAGTLEANTTYEINILDGVYGAVMTWT